MAQKINPTSIKIGQQSSWLTTYQPYGKSLFRFSYFHILQLLSISAFRNPKTLRVLSTLFILRNTFYCNINSIFKQKQVLTSLSFNYLMHSLRVSRLQLKLYPVKEITTFSSNIAFYFQYLVGQKITFRKSFLIVVNLIKDQIGTSKIITLKFGLKKMFLRGFKIQLTGRFETSKLQMSKKLEHTEGSVTLLSANSFIDFLW
uniref:ribosomal protein S3 n=1 Tax=Campylaephora kondoi TaxID=218449 RepID=UPI002E762C20|nr:ribosomal protein S3 [Campylaephora kondoi]WQF69465.1 ribosomal protein S3 [Campylaephora kondoi]